MELLTLGLLLWAAITHLKLKDMQACLSVLETRFGHVAKTAGATDDIVRYQK